MAINFPTGMLFTDPRSNSRLANAQLKFFPTGSAFQLTVYQDAALTLPWPLGPIVADAAGNFPPNIYFDSYNVVGSGGKIKVQLSNSLGVVQWTVDPYYPPFIITDDTLNMRYINLTGFEIRIPLPPSAAPCLVVSNLPGAVALRIIGGGLVFGGTIQPAWAINNLTTGFQSGSFASISNKPGPVSSTPAKWLPILSGGVTFFVPCFL